MAVSQRSPSGGAFGALVRAVALCLLLLLDLTDNVVEAKKVKRVKAGTTYKTHDRKSVKHILGTRFFLCPERAEPSQAGNNYVKRSGVAGPILARKRGHGN